MWIVRRYSRPKLCACFVLVTYVVAFNIFTIFHLSKSNPDSLVHSYGAIYVGYLGKFHNWTCKPVKLSTDLLQHTALASYPGSGNTWLRHLLQQATGIATGSVYVDHDLKYKGFPAEGTNNGSVLVVKTHESDNATLRSYKRAILLIRNPKEAILAEFNRRFGGHLGQAQKEDFDRDWKIFLFEEIENWLNFNLQWLSFPGALYKVNYHNLKQSTRSEIENMLLFLNMTVTSKELLCVTRNMEGYFKRPGSFNPKREKDLFTVSIQHKLRTYWDKVMHKSAERNITKKPIFQNRW